MREVPLEYGDGSDEEDGEDDLHDPVASPSSMLLPSQSLPQHSTRVDRLLMQRLRRNKSHQQMEDLSVSGSLPSGFASLRDAGLLESMPQLSAEGWERLVVVANRLPVTCSRDASGKWQLQVSSGGLVSALKGVSTYETLWVGWPGIWVKPGADRDSLTQLLEREGYIPVWIDPTLLDLYYNGFCNSVLWQLFHYVPLNIDSWQKMAEHKAMQMQWQAYQVANQKFADVVIAAHQHGDIVWVQDYHLMQLPMLLKNAIPKMKVGFFLHTPFPSSEIYRTLPVREDVLKAVLGADLIGFHTYDYARHFISSCTRILGLEGTPEGVENNGTVTRVATFPIGIDPERFTRSLETDEVQSHIAKLLSRYAGRKIMLGVDRLDMVKGIPQKLLAYEKFLEEHPEWRDKVLLVQIAVPSRTDVPEYQKLRSMVHEIVGRINGQFGTLTYVPIYHLDTSLSFTELCALYAVTDVALVTSLRDGMNLVSYEYVACQSDNAGVLVLSEFAGAAQSLGAGAILVNPWNITDMAQAIEDALTMSEEERRERHRQNYMHVQTHTAQNWADNFISELNDTHIEADLRMRHAPPPLHVDQAVQAYNNSKRRLIVLGYNATLTTSETQAPRQAKRHFDHVKAMAKVNPKVLSSIEELCRDPCNVVVVFSGSETSKLEEVFASLPVWLAAENGVYVSPPSLRPQAVAFALAAAAGAPGAGGAGRGAGAGGLAGAGAAASVGAGSRAAQWVAQFDTLNREWMEAVQLVLDYFCERTPRSFVEVRETSLVWNYKYADVEFGRIQARDLLQHLWTGPISNAPVEIIQGGRSVEVRPVGVTKGLAMQRLIGLMAETYGPENACFDFVLCIGHLLVRDENMYTLMEGHSIDGNAPHSSTHHTRSSSDLRGHHHRSAAAQLSDAELKPTSIVTSKMLMMQQQAALHQLDAGLPPPPLGLSGPDGEPALLGQGTAGSTRGSGGRRNKPGHTDQGGRASSGEEVKQDGDMREVRRGGFGSISLSRYDQEGDTEDSIGVEPGVQDVASTSATAIAASTGYGARLGRGSIAPVSVPISPAPSAGSYGSVIPSPIMTFAGQHPVNAGLGGPPPGGSGPSDGSNSRSGQAPHPAEAQTKPLSLSAYRMGAKAEADAAGVSGTAGSTGKAGGVSAAAGGVGKLQPPPSCFPPRYLFTCTVGRNRSKARYSLSMASEVGDLLDDLVHQHSQGMTPGQPRNETDSAAHSFGSGAEETRSHVPGYDTSANAAMGSMGEVPTSSATTASVFAPAQQAPGSTSQARLGGSVKMPESALTSRIAQQRQQQQH